MMTVGMRIAKLASLLGVLWVPIAACGTHAAWQGTGSSELITEAELPDPVAFAVQAIQPGGKTEAVQRVWRDGEASFAVTKSYDVGGVPRRRSVWLEGDGDVIERTHEIAIEQADALARGAIEALDAGRALAVEVVQREPGAELYRFLVEQADGTRSVFECSLTGTDIRRLPGPRSPSRQQPL